MHEWRGAANTPGKTMQTIAFAAVLIYLGIIHLPGTGAKHYVAGNARILSVATRGIQRSRRLGWNDAGCSSTELRPETTSFEKACGSRIPVLGLLTARTQRSPLVLREWSFWSSKDTCASHPLRRTRSKASILLTRALYTQEAATVMRACVSKQPRG